MATQYTINLTIPPATVQQLIANNFSLCGFKVVQSASPNGAPLVWFATQNYLERNTLTWTEQYGAYLAEDTTLAPGTQISASASSPIDFQEQVEATDAGLGTSVKSQDSGMSIISSATKPFICGLMLQPPEGTGGNSPIPLCAFNLLPATVDEMYPIERVVLMFATDVSNTGTVYEQATSGAALIELTGSSPVSVTFDLAVGGWVPAPGVTPQAPPVNLIPLVIPTSMSHRKRK